MRQARVHAGVADRIIPVGRQSPDVVFFDEHNLRAVCKRHNIALGIVGGGPSRVISDDFTRRADVYITGKRRRLTV
jgi:hypothetical protein